ncbi:MAG: hypothetical protein AAF611_23610 [Bacteroidota bacterium]
MKILGNYVVLILLTCICLIACKQEKTTKKVTTANSIDSLLTKLNSCVKDNTYQHHKLKADTAIASLNSYKNYIDRAKRALLSTTDFSDAEDKLNYGSKVDFSLLLQVLLKHNFKCTDKLFLLNGIRPRRDEKGKKIPGDSVAEIIFVLESKDINKQPQYTFFDFTRPCPNGCPDGISNLEYPVIQKLKQN